MSARLSSSSVANAGAAVSFSSSSNSTESPAKLLTKLSGFLDLVGDAGGHLPERGHLLGLVKARLGRLQVAIGGLGGVPRCAQLGGALLDLFLQAFRRRRALGQQRIAFDSVLAKHLDSTPHCSDLVAACDWNRNLAAAAGDRKHRSAHQVQTPHDVASDVEPDDQNRGDETECQQHANCRGAQSLNAKSRPRCPTHLSLGRLDQMLGGIGELG